MFSKPTFYNAIRHSLFNRLTDGQVDGMEAVIDAWLAIGVIEDRFLAYMLATAYHETARTMQPVRETRAESDDRAIAILEKAFANGSLPWVKKPYWRKDKAGKSWLGRGLVQLTHKTNYQSVGKNIGVDLVNNPSLAMDMPVAVKIMFAGMIDGTFTGKRLSDYFTASKADWNGARAIINGKESSEKVASYAVKFYQAITQSRIIA